MLVCYQMPHTHPSAPPPFSPQVFGDAYKATINKEGAKGDVIEVEEDVYEAHNLAQYLAGNKADPSLKTQGVRINGSTKYVEMRALGKTVTKAKVRRG
jgi:hypothetical protein